MKAMTGRVFANHATKPRMPSLGSRLRRRKERLHQFMEQRRDHADRWTENELNRRNFVQADFNRREVEGRKTSLQDAIARGLVAEVPLPVYRREMTDPLVRRTPEARRGLFGTNHTL